MVSTSFKSALDVLDGRIKQFDELRSRSMKGLPKSRAAAFDSLYELLSKIAVVAKNLSTLEASTGLELGYRRVCGNSIFIKTQDSSMFIKFKPLRVVSYSASSNTVRISYENTSVEVAGGSITISLGKLTQTLYYTDPADIANNAAVYSSILSRVMSLPDELTRTISFCAKAIGVRL
ncbi:MAG: hypothetical protein RMI56_02255 [Sulfolobales archaeon]|nr:hypothetical protein [Sulfolobales archaeon]MDW8082599.1 hypothetical protein [Sulfolobales archaeon]